MSLRVLTVLRRGTAVVTRAAQRMRTWTLRMKRSTWARCASSFLPQKRSFFTILSALHVRIIVQLRINMLEPAKVRVTYISGAQDPEGDSQSEEIGMADRMDNEMDEGSMDTDDEEGDDNGDRHHGDFSDDDEDDDDEDDDDVDDSQVCHLSSSIHSPLVHAVHCASWHPAGIFSGPAGRYITHLCPLNFLQALHSVWVHL